MKSTFETGGAAFPVYREGQMVCQRPEDGMTLRDYFAAQALVYLVELHTITNDPKFDKASKRVIAGHAYDFADAMIAARGALENSGIFIDK